MITAEHVDIQAIRDLVGRGRKQMGLDPNESLEGCRGDEFYDSLPEGSTLLHVAAHLKSTSTRNIYGLLLRNRAHETATDENGDTPKDIKDRK